MSNWVVVVIQNMTQWYAYLGDYPAQELVGATRNHPHGNTNETNTHREDQRIVAEIKALHS